MRKIILVNIILLCIGSAQGQSWKDRRIEVSGGFGTTQIFGDIGGYSPGKNVLGLRDFTFRQTRFNINTNLRYNVLKNFAVRANFVFGGFHSTDARGSNITRGFESRTMFFEPSITGEYYWIRNKSETSFLTAVKNVQAVTIFSLLDFYVFAGVGGLAYDIHPNEKLAPHVTRSNAFTPVIPAGVGVNLNYSDSFDFGIELGGRYSFSDHIDGYTSPFSKYNDVYYLLNFTLTYKINTRR